jgi:hypothetical protein
MSDDQSDKWRKLCKECLDRGLSIKTQPWYHEFCEWAIGDQGKRVMADALAGYDAKNPGN